MKNLLKKISILAKQLNNTNFTNRQNELEWLGNTPATSEEILIAETRLGIKFPPDYRDFLLLTNGFSTPNDSTEPTFEPVDTVDYLKNIDPYLIEVWNEPELVAIGQQLNKAIVVGGINDEQYFFLIPPMLLEGNWKYWKFANWIPGEQSFEDLENYFRSVLAFLKHKDNQL